ncbi:MAG: gliding motility protein GldD [Tannerellaceae bacterium]|jgi:gliding motility-associated lipoprotein GldD|nr:gliding motility protein GldD [Tannerellaceae bacterium]
MAKLTGICFLSLCLYVSCAEYTPKPRGYFRIEPPTQSYQSLPLDDLPYMFSVSSGVVVELPPIGDPAGWINLSYPSLGAKIYCSYLKITPATIETVLEESRLLVARQSQNAHSITEQSYSNPDEKVYACLYQLDDTSVSPIQFTLTDSLSNFFRGSLLYDYRPNADSITPVTEYIRQDIIEIVQSFSWKK